MRDSADAQATEAAVVMATSGSDPAKGFDAPPGPKDFAWAVIAGFFALLFGANVVAVFVSIMTTDFSRLLVAPVSLLVTYWFTAGALRRTTWRSHDGHAAPPGPPVLSERTATVYIAVAGGCGIAVAVATAVQLLLARAS